MLVDFISYLRQAPLLGAILTTFAPTSFDRDPESACTGLGQLLNLSSTTVLSATYYSNATLASTLGICEESVANISVPLCRVQFKVATSEISAVIAETWLPTDWNGRFLAIGNGGLSGCIEYKNLWYGAELGFATVATNNGHEGDTGVFFENNPETLTDYVHRAIEVGVILGKEIVDTYYGRPHKKSYYMGCSTGGRQGTYAAYHHPDYFDGILAGAPATDFHHLQVWTALLTKYVGAPHAESSPSFISPDLWKIVSAEVLRQCDELDGLKDGIINEPDACEIRPEAIQCSGRQTKDCLSRHQVDALRKIFEPFYGNGGELLYPRFDPGADADRIGQLAIFSGAPFKYAEHWFKYAIYNDTDWDYGHIGAKDAVFADKVDPGMMSTFSGDMSAFKARGGKFITYHGRRDALIPSGNSKRQYNLISRTMGESSLDSFYRLFLVPGMGHCYGGVGPVNFGQLGSASPSRKIRSHNALLALVDWVEKGISPDTLTGVSADGMEAKMHCRYPQRSVWNGTVHICVA